MVDRHRGESQGAWHHVMNRGVARRTVVEGSRDAEEFLHCVRRVVEEGLLEVHAYCLMATHFHLLVRSPEGELSRAMMLIQNRYARWFNRGRRRDGPLWRGRFMSKKIQSEVYWELLIRYIDHNPVKAGIVRAPDQYQLGSAWYFARPGESAPWLVRCEVEQFVCTRMEKPEYRPEDYVSVFGEPLSPCAQWMLARRGLEHSATEDALGDLVSAAPDAIKKWMRRKAELADGSPMVGVCVLDPEVLFRSLSIKRVVEPTWTLHHRRQPISGWRALHCALLSQFCACTLGESAKRVGVGSTTVARHRDEHAELILRNEEYARLASEVVAAAFAEY